MFIFLQLVSPGAWLTDMCQERYEVREKKSSKKVCDVLLNCAMYGLKVKFCCLLMMMIVKMQRPRGLKAMGSMESDSE